MWWRRVAQLSAAHACHRNLRLPERAAAAARARAAFAKAEAEMAVAEAAASEAPAAAHESVARTNAAATDAIAVAAAAAYVQSVCKARQERGRAWDDAELHSLFERALAAQGATDVQRARQALEPLGHTLRPPPPFLRLGANGRAWSMEGQCEGKTRFGERCKVHRSSAYAIAAPLRRGERFCGHHHPDKYTGVRCAGIKKHGKGQCCVWSGSFYADAAPLRRGSPFCHHHRLRCAGQTRAGERCTVTTSSEHAHADPLRQGNQFCAHYLPELNQQPLQPQSVTV